MKNSGILVLLFICICAFSCSPDQIIEKEVDPNQNSDQANKVELKNESAETDYGITEGAVTLSAVHKFEAIPSSAEANSDGNGILFTELNVENSEDFLNINFSFAKNKEDLEPEIFVAMVTEEKYFVIDFSQKSRSTFFAPPSANGNNAALSMDGYKITAGDATKGNMELSIPKSIHSLYDFSSASGKLYLFALDSGNEESFKDDTFKTCSNILETSF